LQDNTPPPPLRIGILGEGFIEWVGGLEFLRTLCASLHAVEHPVELHLLLPVRGPNLAARKVLRTMKRFVAVLRGRKPAPSHAPALRDIRDAFARIYGAVHFHDIDTGTGAILRAFRKLQLDVLLPAMRVHALPSDVPWVGYLYDFQHQHLPHLFSDEERALRDWQFATMLDAATVVIVNARAVERDARVFRPEMKARIVAMPMNPSPPREWLDGDVIATRARYELERPYFIICNQFWVHKDHRTAFAAFACIASEFPELQLVCTGATSDYRNPRHFDDLMAFARDHGIRDRLHVLGLVSKQDQIDLLRGARAVIQPTLSEGGPGGGAVYDAIALGVPALVSDIPVNLEIEESNVTFFRASDPEALAKAMRQLLQEPTAPTSPDPVQLMTAGQMRRRNCGHALMDAIAIARAI